MKHYDTTITIKLPTEDKELLEAIAKQDDRSMSSTLRLMIRTEAVKRGLLDQ